MLATKLSHIDPTVDPFHDFRNYLYYTFTEVLGFGEPHDIQYDIADWMQNPPMGDDGVMRAQTQAMRGCGKTVIACCYITWLWYCNPTIRVVVISSGGSKAYELGSLVKQIMDLSDLVSHLRPSDEDGYTMRNGKKIKSLKKYKNTEQMFDIRGCGPGKDPSFAAYPVFGGWTGSHPDVIIPDDTEIPENSLTVLKRGRLYQKLRECESLIMEGGQILYMGTPQTEESIYNKLDEAGYPIRRWPSELPDPLDEKRSSNVSPWILNRVREGEEIGSPTYPERFPVERLREKKAKGLAYYNLQYLLDTSLADEERYPLKLKDLIVFDTPCDMGPSTIVWGTAKPITHYEYSSFTGDSLHGPALVEDHWLPFQSKIMYIDPKGGGADSVGYALGAFLNGNIFVLDAGELAAGVDGTSDVVMTKLAKIAYTYDCKSVVVESNWGGSKGISTYAQLLQPHMARWNGPTDITTAHAKGQKEARIIDCLLPVFGSHRLILSESAARCKALTYQITHITKERGALAHDDALDALQGLVHHFSGLLQLDPEVREAARVEAASAALAEEWDREFAKNGGMSWGGIRQQQKRRQPTKRWGKL